MTPETLWATTMRKPALIIAVALAFAGVASADPVTPDDHTELTYRAIGFGLYVDSNAKDTLSWYDENGHECAPIQAACGITFIMVFSRRGISTGSAKYIFDDHDRMLEEHDYAYDGGKLGQLTSNDITLDCVNHTYRLTDLSSGEYVWRGAKALPAIAPVFQYVCAHKRADAVVR